MAETTTISNLTQITLDELTNDTLVPVENVDGTKAANLAQLRKKLNSLYVEMADADLNELKQDGIYECWGTTLNAPTSEVAAWIIQTAEHEGVVVQNAFGLGTTSYSYVYRRRWNGVSWTAWENRILSLEGRVAALETSGAASDLAAVGRIEICGYNNPLPNTLLCNGGAYSRTTYSRLFSKIGTTWGVGDGSTTFNVPNLTDRWVVGSGSESGIVGTLLSQGLPNIVGTFGNMTSRQTGDIITSGAFYQVSPNYGSFSGATNWNAPIVGFDASRSSAIYGGTVRVQPMSSVVNFCIRY